MRYYVLVMLERHRTSLVTSSLMCLRLLSFGIVSFDVTQGTCIEREQNRMTHRLRVVSFKGIVQNTSMTEWS